MELVAAWIGWGLLAFSLVLAALLVRLAVQMVGDGRRWRLIQEAERESARSLELYRLQRDVADLDRRISRDAPRSYPT